MSAIYNFGELGHKLGPEWRWHQKASPSNPNPVDFLLKPQMRGRHIFGATSAHPGKCFEWKVVRDKDNCGAPKFVISEFVLDKSGFRSQQTKISAPSPRLLWNNVFVDLLGLSAPNHGADLCGFHDTSLPRLLIVHSLGNMPSYETFLKFDDLTRRYQRDVAAHVNAAFEETMARVCPQDPQLAFAALRESARWQADWMPKDEYMAS